MHNLLKKMIENSTTKFLFSKFDRGNFPMQKVKIHIILKTKIRNSSRWVSEDVWRENGSKWCEGGGDVLQVIGERIFYTNQRGDVLRYFLQGVATWVKNKRL